MSRVDLKNSPSSRIGQPREKQSDDLEKNVKKTKMLNLMKRPKQAL